MAVAQRRFAVSFLLIFLAPSWLLEPVRDVGPHLFVLLGQTQLRCIHSLHHIANSCVSNPVPSCLPCQGNAFLLPLSLILVQRLDSSFRFYEVSIGTWIDWVSFVFSLNRFLHLVKPPSDTLLRYLNILISLQRPSLTRLLEDPLNGGWCWGVASLATFPHSISSNDILLRVKSPARFPPSEVTSSFPPTSGLFLEEGSPCLTMPFVYDLLRRVSRLKTPRNPLVYLWWRYYTEKRNGALSEPRKSGRKTCSTFTPRIMVLDFAPKRKMM